MLFGFISSAIFIISFQVLVAILPLFSSLSLEDLASLQKSNWRPKPYMVIVLSLNNVNTCSYRINYNVWKVFIIFTIPDKKGVRSKDLMPFFVG